MGLFNNLLKSRVYHRVLDSAGYPFLLMDKRTTRFVYSNKAATELYGYSAKEFHKLTPLDLSTNPTETGKAIGSPGPKTVITSHKKKDGTIITVRIKATQAGKYVTAVIQDITEDSRLREDLVRNELRLHDAQKLGKLGWWEYSDATGRYNGSTELSRIFFDTERPFSISFTDLLNMIHPDDRESTSNRIREAMESAADTYTLDYRIKTPRGAEKYLSIISNINRDINGTPVGRFGICQDVTESRIIMDQLVIARMKAEESERLKVAFLGNFSHELRTPLNAIVGFSNLLTSPNAGDIDKKEMIRQINLNSERLVRLVNDVYELSKMESDSLELHYTDVDVNSFIKKLDKIVSCELEAMDKSDLVVNYNMPATEMTVTQFADPVKLKQVFASLISNALKFTPEGGITIGYSVSSNKDITYYVKDTGIGIDPVIMQDIFNPFFQGESFATKMYQGAGLGLSIVKNLVTIMNGKVWVENNNGKGSAFYFTLGTPVTIEKTG